MKLIENHNKMKENEGKDIFFSSRPSNRKSCSKVEMSKKKICSRKLLLRTVNSAEFIPYYITQWDLQAPYLEQTTWSW